MRKYIIVIGIGIGISISMVGITTVNAQTDSHIQTLDDGFGFLTAEIFDCSATLMTTNRNGFYFDKPLFQPKLHGSIIEFNLFRSAECTWMPPLGNIDFKVNWVTKLFISGENGYVGVNNANPGAQFDVKHTATTPWGHAILATVNNDYTKALVVVNASNQETFIVYGNGSVRASEVRVCVTQGCDYVFAEDYKLMNLSDLSKFIKTNKHLPDVAPAAEMEAEGINLSETNTLLLRKIEELTLYILRQDEQMKDLQKRLSELETKKGDE
jgi:hypothetical protein